MDQQQRSLLHAIKIRLGLLLILAGIAVMLVPLITYVQGVCAQHRLLERWERERIAPPTKQPQRPKTLMPTLLLIPKIHLKAVLVEGVTDEALRKGPGHFPGTAMPGEDGNCCIAGHRNMYGYWFRRLDRLSKGDAIILQQRDSEFTYRVAAIRTVQPKEASVLDPSETATLTLVTCTPVPRPTKRLIVIAELAAITTSQARTNPAVL